MNFNDLHSLAKRIDTQVKSLESKVSDPMSMIYSKNYSNQGVKLLTTLKGKIEEVDKKKVNRANT